MKRFVVSALLAVAGSILLATSPCPGGAGAAHGAAAARQPTEEATVDAAPSSDVLASVGAKLSSTPPADLPASCPTGMVEVEGEYCPVVEQFCTRQVDPKHPERDRCAEFAPTGRCLGTPTHKRFCIDRYEWPNAPGVKPDVAMDWNTAHDSCTKVGKRLCGDTEWTLACEGQERLPYPYGYVRNADACNIDRPYIMPDDAKWSNLRTRTEEIARLDQRDASGTRDSCVSPYGVYDMTGNVDEWVTNEKGKEREKPYVSGLKGGYWGPVRDRCRPMTTDHNQWHAGYQIGFRCCEDVPAPPGATTPATGSPAGS